jgi:hypothetical protein
MFGDCLRSSGIRKGQSRAGHVSLSEYRSAIDIYRVLSHYSTKKIGISHTSADPDQQQRFIALQNAAKCFIALRSAAAAAAPIQ